jgi:hypothetical protein
VRGGLVSLVRVAKIRKAVLCGLQRRFRADCHLVAKVLLGRISIGVEAFLPLTDWRKIKLIVVGSHKPASC